MARIVSFLHVMKEKIQTYTPHKPSQLVPVIQGGHWQWYFEESTLSFTQTPSL